MARLAEKSGDVQSRVELVTLLGELKPDGALPLFLSLFDAEDVQLRSAALVGIVELR